MAVDFAVAYDFLQSRGGAERVSLLLAQRMDADLLVHATSAQWRANTPHRLRMLDIHELSNNAYLRAWRTWRSWKQAASGNVVKLRDYRGVLLSGHYAPLAAPAFEGACRVLYLHACPHALAGAPEAADALGWSKIQRRLLRPAIERLHDEYLRAVIECTDAVVANSSWLASLFSTLTGRSASVLPPPIADEFFSCRRAPQGYWLSMARHEPQKRIELIVDTFRTLPDIPLVIAGSGSLTRSLMRRAANASNITFSGSVDTARLVQLLSGAVGTLHVAAREPFGLAVAESLGAGVPVVVGGNPGAASLIDSGVSGAVLSENPSLAELRDAVTRFHLDGTTTAASERIRSTVRHLDEECFARTISNHLERR